jgi:hypothetical protein
MRRIVIAAGLVALAMPATAQADKADCAPALERSYSGLYRTVAERHGVRAPGRNIRAYGVRFRGIVFSATCGELRRSRGQLRRLASRAPYHPLLVRQAIRPAQPPAGVQSAGVGAGGTLAAIRACESGSSGGYSANTGNGFYGAYQFDLQTWQSVGGSGNPAAASPAEQDRRAAMLYAQRGSSPWPVCGR